MTSSQSIQFETADQGEETARADLYGLLATLFYAPPSASLLNTLSAAQTQGEGVLGQAWSGLVQTARVANAEQVREEYEQLFIGVGKPEVMLYGSYYISGFLMEKPLAALRTDLAQMGLERIESVVETEDHIASLCEVMRYLIASEDILQAHIASQKKFFGAHMQAWVLELCDAVTAHPSAVFYAATANLARAFFEVEMQAFDMT
ncbi:molecular chaperone TorD family protein [Undibacterium sp. Jales W-56]|uniref:TorD/DmsD family molecular chaperone n=1 Tax=Undibacterium sp. Jales W-56 TaxID=2897325 RepID=UPI0021D16899|nr:molecular chaperone TorD family protein [Undibacterium sp. Jales W-56]MCU6432900.1 molecular chaperone TorD family protein [Undibacterium sp. Jales W-56]